MSNVVLSVTPYDEQDLVTFDYYSPEMDYDYSLWGKDKQATVTESETFSITENVSYQLGSYFKENLKIKDALSTSVKMYLSDTINVNDSTGSGVSLTLHDGVSVVDSHIANPAVYLRDDIILIDQDESQPNTVLFDLELNGVDSFQTFVDKKSPVGYEALRPLLPGEYEYKNAIVGVQLEIPQSEGRFGIIGSVLNVDVEDTVEKGTVVLDGTGYKTVNFTKKFYSTPKILTSLVESQGVGIIEVITVSKEYFTIGLKNNGSFISGTVDWLADGY